MIDREPENYTNGCGRWKKEKLIQFILGCRGEPVKGKKKGYGWGFSFF